MKPFSAKGLAEHGKSMMRYRARSGIGIRAKSTRGGVILSADPDPQDFRHPWKLSAKWDVERKEWVASVVPGFVNGREVEIGGVSLIAKDRPLIRLGFRPTPQRPKELEKEVQRGNEVWKCDVWLEQPRAAMRQSIEVSSPSATAATFTISATIQGKGGTPQLRAGRYVQEEQPSEADFLTGMAFESNVDTIRIATVYAICIPGQGPNETARIRTRNDVFWNLMHASPPLPRELDSTPFTLSVPLAGGIGQGAVNLALSRDNDAREKALAYLNRFRRKGYFWSV